MEHRPQQLDSHSSTFSQVLPLVDPIDCICGMTLPPHSPPSAPVSSASSASLEEFPSSSNEVFTIQCDECGRWLHGSCVGIAPDDVIPDTFSCPKCIQERKALLQQQQQTLSKQQLAGKLRKSTTKASPIQSNGVDDYPYVNHNTVAGDASSVLKLLQVDSDHLEDALPQPLSGSYANVNFEFAGDIIPIPSAHTLSELDKNIEVKEIRYRGQVLNRKGAKRGIFSLQYIDIGQSICEFCGHIVRIESMFSKVHKITTVPQSFVLFPSSKADVVVDARRHGSQARWARRSCRPNTTVKSVLYKGSVLWYLFAKQTIKPGDELFLPLDWETGNRFFRYECGCNSPETCLAPDELLPEGYRENLIQREDLPTVTSVDLVSAPVSAHPERKLSREEKKLQRYIEAFEKMENAERKKSRVTPPSSSPETSRRQSIKQQPVHDKSISPAQPKKMISGDFIPSILPMKKIWAAKQSKKHEQEVAKPPLHSSLSSEITSTEEEPIEEIQREAVVIGPREETPVSQLVSDEATSSSAKRLSLSDFLHRKISQIHHPPLHEEKSSLPGLIAEDVEEGDSKAELSSTSSSRESGEYIEAPSFSPIKYQHNSPPRSYRERSRSPPEGYDYPQNQQQLPPQYPDYDYYEQYHHRTPSQSFQHAPPHQHHPNQQYNYNRQQKYYDYDDTGYYQQQPHYPHYQQRYRPQPVQQTPQNLPQYDGYYDQGDQKKRHSPHSTEYYDYSHDSFYHQSHRVHSPPLQQHPHITHQQHSDQSSLLPGRRPPLFRPRHGRPPPSRDKPPFKKDKRDFHPPFPPPTGSSSFR